MRNRPRNNNIPDSNGTFLPPHQQAAHILNNIENNTITNGDPSYSSGIEFPDYFNNSH